MDVNISEQDYIDHRLNDQIEWYDNKSLKSKKYYVYIKIFQLFITSVMPILSYFTSSSLKIWVIIISCLLVFLESLNSLFKNQENWIEYRKTSELLKQEKYMYLARSGIYEDACNEFTMLVERCETIISSENINWSNMQNNKECKNER